MSEIDPRCDADTPTVGSSISDGGATSGKFHDLGSPGRERTDQVSIHLIDELPPHGCNFWIGFNRCGDRAPADLLNLRDPARILFQSAESGTSEAGQLLLTDTESTPPGYYLLVPPPVGMGEELQIWRDDVISALAPWAPSAIGVYLREDSLGSEHLAEITRSLLQALCLQSECRKIYLLCGALGLNFLLQVAFDSRPALVQAGLECEVYH